MEALSQAMENVLSSGPGTPAILVLEDGTIFEGRSCGAPGIVFGEICFNTSLEGYLEVITDPSYAGQIVTMTYPQIGNYGVNLDDIQSKIPALRGLVVRDLCRTPSSWRSSMSLGAYLESQGIVAMDKVDTRALVRHIRERGAMGAALASDSVDAQELLAQVKASAPLVGTNLVKTVSRTSLEPYELKETSRDFALKQPEPKRYRVVAFDCGVKDSILEGLARAGCDLTIVPWDTTAEAVLALNPDGVFLSNGPGDPDAVRDTSKTVEALLGQVPIFGICLGHQMICKAAGGSMVKLKYGHRGGNHPVKNLLSGRVEITAQNHGFNLDPTSLGPLDRGFEGLALQEDLKSWAAISQAPVVMNDRFGPIVITHVNLNDGTVEGIAFKDIPAFSVQYHPEASPGPTDAHYLFKAFTRLMDGDPNYLNIDISKDRVAGWRF